MALLRSSQFILGNQTTRATLTNAYSGNTSAAFKVQNAVQLYLQVEYTMGAQESGNSIEISVEFADPESAASSPAAAEWYRETTESVGLGTVTVDKSERTYTADSAAATYDRINIDIPNGHKYIRVAIKESGVASNYGSASVKLVSVEEESIN